MVDMVVRRLSAWRDPGEHPADDELVTAVVAHLDGFPCPGCRAALDLVRRLRADLELARSFACRCTHDIKRGMRECAYHKRLAQLQAAGG